jgi:hypothetical protein
MEAAAVASDKCVIRFPIVISRCGLAPVTSVRFTPVVPVTTFAITAGGCCRTVIVSSFLTKACTFFCACTWSQLGVSRILQTR